MNPSLPYSDPRGTNGANGSIHGIGHSQDWPSMGSFFGGGGESMENIAQFLAHYQSQNVDGEPASDKTKDFEPSSASKQRADDIGLSLDESSAPNSTSKSMSAVKANLYLNVRVCVFNIFPVIVNFLKIPFHLEVWPREMAR